MADPPRPQSIYRVQSTASEHNSLYPIQSAQSSLSSFTSYFGASTIGPNDDERPSSGTDLHSPVPKITKAFAPYVPIVASKDANGLAKRKGFASMFDLIRPFGADIESKVSYKDIHGQANTLDNFNLNFLEMGPASNLINYGQSDVQRPGLAPPSTIYAPGGDLVALERQIENEMHLAGENLSQSMNGADQFCSKTGSGSYYDSFFTSLLAGLPTSPHESFSHPVASCIIITSHNETPIETLVALYKSSSEQLPAYIDPGFLRYYVLVHDEDEHDLDKSLALFARMKNSFGIHCYMLRLTSRSVTLDDDAVLEVPEFSRKSAPERLRSKWHGSRMNSQFLNNSGDGDDVNGKVRYIPYVDHTGLVSLVREMVTQSIVPYMERCIHIWNEQVAAPRRGLAGRFFKAGRSLWGSSRSATPVHGNGNYDPTTSSYPPNSPEAQLRKLADFAFMLRDWKTANSVYDMLRKDYSNDKAWKHHAGAQEMFVVSQLLIPGPITTRMRAETIEPTLDSALYGYLSRCSAPFSALRAMLLTAELLRIRPGGAIDDAAKWIMRIMESNLVGEMTRALLVERTSYCFANGETESAKTEPDAVSTNYTGTRKRKAAFWSVLAAEHWSTISKHRLARHAITEALKVYGNSEWIAIQGTLNLLKAETGLVDEYHLTPPVPTDTKGPQTPRASQKGVEERQATAPTLPKHDTAEAQPGSKQETPELPDEDDTTTLAQSTVPNTENLNLDGPVVADSDTENATVPTPESITDIATREEQGRVTTTPSGKIGGEEEEIKDPLRID
ncbi:Putative uncharacterized protein [Taphrina deformans PYCC 5710]|uniref:TRAPP complex protein TRS85 n=1 Tax=Taphrina deformans (strain PYCC 5710 / ATCC 11124 / CBS 356.35 / IMI 108563 / JCM 9778 / NBRC 8474) TaxID=1097556 RepID=R4XH17_TAPDE|nr:Putative uncharacterized protein [Taphrina deformans PYCC 5710]|eukprot:CCG82666.1 Putative uncharacterized protein [Taphrina deformans PYCC 5710]